MPRIDLLGIGIDTLSREALLHRCQSLMTDSRAHQLITANALLVLEAQKFPQLKAACDSASLVSPESSGVTWALKHTHNSASERTAGVDLAFHLCGLAAKEGHRVYLFGGEPDVAHEAANHLRKNFPNITIVGVKDGFSSDPDGNRVREDIQKQAPRLTLVALGMPKQDLWIHRHLKTLPPGLYMGVGGTFDVWAGRVKRAPKWLQKTGLEWAYRFVQEPWRWPRMIQLPVFAFKVYARKFLG